VILRSLLASSLATVLAGFGSLLNGAHAPAHLTTGAEPMQVGRASADDAIASVLAISIDGLDPNALRKLGRDGAPALHALLDAGASTLNARTEREVTTTLPNHTGMVTGRRVQSSAGGHGVTWNDDRRRPPTVQAAAGRPIASVYTAVHGSGGSTALFASKTKFSLWNRSWPASIDLTRIQLDNRLLVRSLRRDLRDHVRAFRLLHLSLPDSAGHDRGFMSRPYLRAVARIDSLVGELVSAVTSDVRVAGSTAIILTSDHGGQGVTHSDATEANNYRIPFVVTGPGVTPGADLYELNPDYRDPGAGRTTYERRRQPIRNGVLANLALDLLDLDAVQGSEHNARQDINLQVSESE
jgi:predicted AlkP superfamily pyrophosphatase or phosphodiesterase